VLCEIKVIQGRMSSGGYAVSPVFLRNVVGGERVPSFEKVPIYRIKR
jgi:hypothetical protein